jgi:hypothetical protein
VLPHLEAAEQPTASDDVGRAAVAEGAEKVEDDVASGNVAALRFAVCG